MKNILLTILVAVLAAAFLTSCAAKPKVLPNPELGSAVPVSTPSADTNTPEFFEKSIPKSPIMLNALVVFDKTYPRVYSDNSVIDISAGEKVAAVLKQNELGFTMPACSALSVDDNFNSVKVDGYAVTIAGYDKIEVYSAFDCLRFSSLKRILRGGFAFLKNGVIEWEGSKVVLREVISGNTLSDANIGIDIASAGIINDKIALVLKNGYIMTYNEDIKAFTMQGSFPIVFSSLGYSEGKFYGLASDGTFFIIGDKTSDITPFKECSLSNNSAYAICDKTLVGLSSRYDGVSAGRYFSSGDKLLLELNDGNLNIYALNSSWQRVVKFEYTLPDPCMSDGGLIYFHSFESDGVIQENSEERSTKRPDKCDSKSVILKNGQFLCGNDKKLCGTFAEIVNSDNDTIMLRRIENGKWYYYFEPKN